MESIIVILSKKADSPRVSGLLEYRRKDGSLRSYFSCVVLRIEEMKAQSLLERELPLMALTLLADLEEMAVADVLKRMEHRVFSEAPEEVREDLWTCIYVISGLRYNRDTLKGLFQGVQRMKESTTYQEIYHEGKLDGEEIGEERGVKSGKISQAIVFLKLIGEKHLGAISEIQEARLHQASLEQLETWANYLLQTTTWQELLAIQALPKPNGMS